MLLYRVLSFGFLALLPIIPLAAQTAPRPATIVFYRIDADPRSATGPSVYAGDQRLGTIHWGQFLIVRAEPALYRFGVHPPGPGVQYFSIIVRNGDEMYFRVDSSGVNFGSAAEAYQSVPTLALTPAPVTRMPAAITGNAPLLAAAAGTAAAFSVTSARDVSSVSADPAIRTRHDFPESFTKAKLTQLVDGRRREVEATLSFEASAFIVVDKKTGTALKTISYTAVESAEYSYARTPRWKAAVSMNPVLLQTDGTKHWFLVYGGGDYALLQLDRSNYRLVLAAFETRTGKLVGMVGESN